MTKLNDKTLRATKTAQVVSVFAAAARNIEAFDKAWKVELTGVLKVARTEDKRLDTDSQSISKMVGKYIVLATAYNKARPVGAEGDGIAVDFTGLSKHIKVELIEETASRAMNKRIQRGVRHQLFAHVEGARDIFKFIDSVLNAPHNIINPMIASFDQDGKQVGMIDNPNTDMTPVKTSDVDRLWKTHAPKSAKGPDNKTSKDATQQQANSASKEQILTDFGQAIRGGNIPTSMAGKRAALAVLQSGLTKNDLLDAIEGHEEIKLDAVA